MERFDYNVKQKTELCKKWLVIERCSWCLFETLCHYQDMKQRIEDEQKNEDSKKDSE
jgi:hypothetical protein